MTFVNRVRSVVKNNAKITAIVAGVAIIGGASALLVRAATPFVSTEPEKGVVTSGATIIEDTAASGGQSIAFRPRFATTAPTTADGFTQMFANKNDQTWSGGDQSTSYRAPNGYIYWLSGDTMLSSGTAADGSYPAGSTMISNRMLMQQGGQLVNGMANGGLLVPDPPTRTTTNSERYWPQALVYTNNKMYVFSQRVTSADLGNFNLEGSEISTYSIAADGKLTFIGMKPTPTTGVKGGVGPAHIQWSGDALIKDGYVFVYGYTNAAPNPYVPHYSYVARVPTAQIETPTAWQYYKKSTNQWVGNTSQLSTDMVNQPDAILPTQLGTIREIGGKFVAVHKPWNGYGSTVFAEISSTPYGPFTQKPLFDSPQGTWQTRNYITYMPMLHPEQTLSGIDQGKILVSINRNGVDFFADVMKNADLYKPQFYAFPPP